MLRKTVLILAIFALMVATQATPGSATSYGLNNGDWTETYNVNGNSGQVGNLLNATDLTTWSLTNFAIDNQSASSTSGGFTVYTTTYSGGTLAASGYGGPALNSSDTILTVRISTLRVMTTVR